MKTYSIPSLKKIAQEQGYKMAALEDQQGKRIVSFNQLKTKVNTQLDLIPTRLKSEINPDGVYFVLMAQNINKSKDPDKFPVLKGKVAAEELAEVEKKTLPLTPTIVMESPSVLTYAKALEYQQEISDLKSEVAILKMQLQSALDENAALQDGEDERDETKHDGMQGIAGTLKDLIPSLIPLADRFFALEEKKLDLEKLKLHKVGAKKQVDKGTRTREILPGSPEHLEIIERYYNEDNEEALNTELDKLEAASPELYRAVCDRLEIDIEEGGVDV